MKVRFLIYGLLGWILEVLWTGLGSALRGDWGLVSRTYLWMFPIYGLAVFFEPLHDRIRRWPWPVRGLVWVAAIWAVEYSTGWVLRALVGRTPWDYTGKTPYSVRGLIRLDYAPAWLAAGLLFERAHDWLTVWQARLRPGGD